METTSRFIFHGLRLNREFCEIYPELKKRIVGLGCEIVELEYVLISDNKRLPKKLKSIEEKLLDYNNDELSLITILAEYNGSKDLFFSFSFDLDRETCVVSNDADVHAIPLDFILENFNPSYAYEAKLRQGESAYQYAFSGPRDDSWQFNYRSRLYKLGYLRGAFEKTIVDNQLIETKINGLTMAKWISGGERRGRLSPMNDRYQLWEIDESDLEHVNTELKVSGRLLDRDKALAVISDQLGVDINKPMPPLRQMEYPAIANKEPAPGQIAQRNKLIARLDEGKEGDDLKRLSGSWLLTIDTFFEGNYEEGSIAPNQVGVGLPPLAEMRSILSAIEDKKEVAAVWVEVRSYPDPDDETDFEMWMEGDHVFIVTTADRDTVDTWVRQPLAVTEVLRSEFTELDQGEFKTYQLVWD